MKNTKMRRGIKLTVVLLISLIILSFWIYWGNSSIQTTVITIESDRIPSSFNEFNIVHISDLHNAEFGEKQSKLLIAIENAAPDMIVVTGDMIDSRHPDLEKAMNFIDAAINMAPIYYVTGNHEARIDEYKNIEKRMLAADVTILRNESIAIEHKGNSIRLLGLDDPSFTLKSTVQGDIADVINTRLKDMLGEEKEYKILLSHRPELFEVYAANRIDLVLCGHAHGGQMRLPYLGGILAPNQGLFPKYTEGVHKKDGTKMVVSRGLGNSIFPFRINNRPELIVITLQNDEN